jgi:uncharacterized protein
MKKFLFSFIIFTTTLSANPWGKDSDLVYYKYICEHPPVVCEQSFNPLSKIGQACVRFHQNVISPIDGPRSHFFPSSSQYTKEAMQKYGFFIGVVYGCDRLMRENDEEWVYKLIEGPYGCLKLNPVR